MQPRRMPGKRSAMSGVGGGRTARFLLWTARVAGRQRRFFFGALP